MKKYSVIIQARMGSSRLPEKILKKVKSKMILEYVINQIKSSEKINEIIIATTKKTEDDIIENFCKERKIKYFRGSENDLLDRYYQCAKKYNCDPIIRITSDCPLIDPNVIDKIIFIFEKNNYDYVSNNIEFKNNRWVNSLCNFPQGMTVEITSQKNLEKAWREAKKPSEREHVFPYIQFNPDLFKIHNIFHDKDLTKIRCTIDRIEDLKFLEALLVHFPEKKIITIKDIEKVIRLEPNLIKINSHIDFEEGWRKSIKKDLDSVNNEK